MMRNRIAKFLVTVPMAAGFIVNTNTNNENINKNLISQPQPVIADSNDHVIFKVTNNKGGSKKTKIVLAGKDKKITPDLNVKPIPRSHRGNDVEKTETENISPEQLAVMEKMVSGHPIENMLPFIAKRNPVTAAFLVSIAKKESNWGKRSPRSAKGDCFNYWGFKDHRFPFVSGHSCFPSAEAAVEAVGNRIDKLVSQGRDNPAELVVWKCGSACAKDGNKGKWISDVNLYFRPILAAR